jgi:hypothetical protein
VGDGGLANPEHEVAGVDVREACLSLIKFLRNATTSFLSTLTSTEWLSGSSSGQIRHVRFNFSSDIAGWNGVKRLEGLLEGVKFLEAFQGAFKTFNCSRNFC